MNHSTSGDFQCKACGSTDGLSVADLGNQPLANNLLLPEDLSKAEPRFPLRLMVCQKCWLLQIADLVPPTELFSEYLYFSSFSDALLQHARQAALRYIEEFSLNASSQVVEIASNDGYLLKNFVAAGVPSLGIEPAANVARVAIEKGIATRVEFFSPEVAAQLVAEGRQADLILGNNVFAHVPFINEFVDGLRLLLKPQGRVVLEFPYAGDFMEKCEFDTVYHEHVFYFFLTPLLALFEKHGLEIYQVERLRIHGGSLRLFAGLSGAHTVHDSVAALRDEEFQKGVCHEAEYADFSRRVATIRHDLLAMLAKLKSEGKTIAAYGASAKGSTLLNFVNPPEGTLDFIVDRSTYKQGRLSPGLHLPILPAEELLARQPDYALLLTWNFSEEILKQQEEYQRRGGRFIIPIPQVRIV